jgi:hypothetical protein
MTTLAIILALIVAALASVQVLAGQRGQRRAHANAGLVAAAVADYFAHSGVRVGAQCLPIEGRYLVLVESEPLKRFRYSHIVEASLIAHVEKTLGLQVDRVFWRFPLPVGTAAAHDAADVRPALREDEYVAEGLRAAKTKPEYHVAEDSWEQYEKARTMR